MRTLITAPWCTLAKANTTLWLEIWFISGLGLITGIQPSNAGSSGSPLPIPDMVLNE